MARVALVHYWLVGMRGGESVLEEYCRMFPDADIYTHVYDPDSVSEVIRGHSIATTFIDKLPFSKTRYPYYLPFMPLALEQLDLTSYDLVISFESGPAKGIIVAPDAVHVCYCHSPMRYLWDLYGEYMSVSGKLKRKLMAPVIHYLRMWDVSSSHRVDHFIANSSFVRARIERYYRRSATVIHPPVDVGTFTRSENNDGQGSYYLFLGQLVPYKRADLAISSFNESGRKLLVVGDGDQRKELEKMAQSNIEFLGRVSGGDLREIVQRCKALVFPGIEDFGIVPLEAMACGKPVIAYGRGGALDTVVEGKTGVFFGQQTPESLNDAVERFEEFEGDLDEAAIARHAQTFSSDEFRSKNKAFLKDLGFSAH